MRYQPLPGQRWPRHNFPCKSLGPQAANSSPSPKNKHFYAFVDLELVMKSWSPWKHKLVLPPGTWVGPDLHLYTKKDNSDVTSVPRLYQPDTCRRKEPVMMQDRNVHRSIWIRAYTHIHKCTYIYTHIHIYAHTYIHIWIHTYTHIYMHIHAHIYLYTYMYIYANKHVHILVYTHTGTYTQIQIHEYVQTDINTYAHMHIHINTHMHTSTYIYVHTCIYTDAHIYICTYIHT